MTKYLMFQLYGPLVSWGEIAVGQVRHTAGYPSKSALLGLLGAALGIRRDQEIEQKNLANSYRFFIKVLSTGSLLQDYHTTQTNKSLKNRAYHSRREALARDEKSLPTILSTREYRCDSFAIIAVQTDQRDFYSLESIYQALLNPKYHLYLGRKSCPPALPLHPLIYEASGPKSALDFYHDKLRSSRPFADYLQFLHLNTKNQSQYYWEGEASDLKSEYSLIRHDQPISRHRWQFAPRREESASSSKTDQQNSTED
jgi:CRISPR system Cascade subunit CasD